MGMGPEEGLIDYPLKEQLDKIADAFSDPDRPAQEAVTAFRRLHQVELPLRRLQEASHQSLQPGPALSQDGRKHQLRRHLDHLFHPIVGDTTHGDGRTQPLLSRALRVRPLLLIAHRLSFEHPVLKVPMRIQAPLGPEVLGLFAVWAGLPASKTTAPEPLSICCL